MVKKNNANKEKKQEKDKRIAVMILLKENKISNLGWKGYRRNRWSVTINHPIYPRKKTKLSGDSMDKIVEIASNKSTSEMGLKKLQII